MKEIKGIFAQPTDYLSQYELEKTKRNLGLWALCDQTKVPLFQTIFQRKFRWEF